MPFRPRYTGLIDKYRDRLPVHDDTRVISLGEGNTPLIRLKKASEETGCEILGKAEFMNPGQSVKDRAALFIIKDAIPFFRLEGIGEFFTSTRWYPSRRRGPTSPWPWPTPSTSSSSRTCGETSGRRVAHRISPIWTTCPEKNDPHSRSKGMRSARRILVGPTLAR